MNHLFDSAGSASSAVTASFSRDNFAGLRNRVGQGCATVARTVKESPIVRSEVKIRRYFTAFVAVLGLPEVAGPLVRMAL